MNQNNLIFIISFFILLFSSLIFLNNNPIHSILYLALVFICVTGLLIILKVEFIAMLFLIVYVGAIMVLFLFVIMMLNVKIMELNERIVYYIPIGMFLGLIFFLEILYLVSINLNPKNYNFLKDLFNSNYSFNVSSYYPYIPVDISYNTIIINTDIVPLIVEFINFFNSVTLTSIELIGNLLYGKYPYIVALAGLLLLIAVIGSIILTSNQKLKNKRQDIYSQTNKEINTSIKHIDKTKYK